MVPVKTAGNGFSERRRAPASTARNASKAGRLAFDRVIGAAPIPRRKRL